MRTGRRGLTMLAAAAAVKARSNGGVEDGLVGSTSTPAATCP